MSERLIPVSVPSHATEPMMGGTAGRSYDGHREVFIARTLATPFVGDDSLSDFTGDTGSVSVGEAGLSASGPAVITTTEPGLAPGEEFCTEVTASSANNAWLLYFGTQDASNTYYSRVDFGAGQLELGALVAGATDPYQTQAVAVSASTTYTLHVRWHTDSKLSAELFDPDEISLGSVAGDAGAGYSAGGYGHEFTGAGVSTAALEECGAVGDAGAISRVSGESWEPGPVPALTQRTSDTWAPGSEPALTTQTTETWG